MSALMSCPAVSVIIPMYNAEKYIGECLDSLLAQTFQNFEVIVVDDCSTDSSCAIVESYAEKFDGRLTLAHMEENSGCGAIPRNKGIEFARGEYIQFIDADDFIAKDALEILYSSAKEYDADVVYTNARYFCNAKGDIKRKRDWFGNALIRKGINDDEPTLTIGDPHKNLKNLLVTGGWFWTTWTKLVKREFLIEKNITFCELYGAEDYIWTIELIANAKRFLRIPNAIYYYRCDVAESITHSKRTTVKQICLWYKNCLYLTKAIADLFNKNNILKGNTEYLYFALTRAFRFCHGLNLEARLQVSSQQIFNILHREFENIGNVDLAIPFMFSILDGRQKALIKAKEVEQTVEGYKTRIAELEAEVKRLQTNSRED